MGYEKSVFEHIHALKDALIFSLFGISNIAKKCLEPYLKRIADVSYWLNLIYLAIKRK